MIDQNTDVILALGKESICLLLRNIAVSHLQGKLVGIWSHDFDYQVFSWHVLLLCYVCQACTTLQMPA